MILLAIVFQNLNQDALVNPTNPPDSYSLPERITTTAVTVTATFFLSH